MAGTRTAMHQQKLLLAECAAEWLERLKTQDRQTRAEFVRWLRQSPLHVREMLLAITCDAEMNRVDPDHKIDISALLRQSSTDVVPIRSGRDFAHRRQRHGAVRWFWIAGLGALVAFLIFFFGWIRGEANLPQLNQWRTAVGETLTTACDSLVRVSPWPQDGARPSGSSG